MQLSKTISASLVVGKSQMVDHWTRVTKSTMAETLALSCRITDPVCRLKLHGRIGNGRFWISSTNAWTTERKKKRDLLQNQNTWRMSLNESPCNATWDDMRDVSLFYRDGRLMKHAKTNQK
jgi:hypothetical protein